MSFISSGQRSYAYLTDGDGFPTNIKYNYWKRYYSDFTDFQLASRFGVRSIALETVDSGEYFSMHSTKGNFGWSGRDGANNPNSWNNARDGGFQKGAINFIPLTPKEAIQVYWNYRGVQCSYSPSTINVNAQGAKARTTPATICDAGNTINQIAPPYTRIWQATTGNSAVAIPSNSTGSDRVIWRTGRRGGSYYARASARCSQRVFVPYNNLIRMGKRGAVYDYGFETLFDSDVFVSTAQDDEVISNYDSQIGNSASSNDAVLGSVFYYPENEPANQFGEEFEYTMEKVNISGVPLILAQRILRRREGVHYNKAIRIEVNITDVFYEKI